MQSVCYNIFMAFNLYIFSIFRYETNEFKFFPFLLSFPFYLYSLYIKYIVMAFYLRVSIYHQNLTNFTKMLLDPILRYELNLYNRCIAEYLNKYT